MNSSDEKLKQRLVGVIVLTAIMVIFLPMLFDEEVSDKSISSREMPRFPVEFEKDIPKVPSRAEIAERITNAKLKSRESSEPNSDLESWIVQIGSFVKKNNAEMLRDTLRKSGFAAFVETFGEAKTIGYRVRVGPELNREDAEQTKNRIEKKFKTKGLLVPYP